LGTQEEGLCREELYQLYALVITGISVSLIAIKETIIPLFQAFL